MTMIEDLKLESEVRSSLASIPGISHAYHVSVKADISQTLHFRFLPGWRKDDLISYVGL